jgi:peroxisomal 3,2-trans-enoyl-CoA isomerase
VLFSSIPTPRSDSSMSEGLPFKATRPPPSTASSSPISLTFPTHSGSKAGLIAQLTINSPSNLNALRSTDIQAIIATIEWINEQSDVLITVLTGVGRFFSAGANVSDTARQLPAELSALSPDDPLYHSGLKQFYAQRAYNNNSRFARCLYHHDKVLVAALNGPAVGIAAAGLAYCDFVYCFEEFWLGTPFTSLALVAEAGASKTFVKRVSAVDGAMGQEAKRCGLLLTALHCV